MTDLGDAVREYMEASEALHTVHGSSDVHGHGGIAAAVMTPHCAWSCNVVGFHIAEKRRFVEARANLIKELDND